MGQKYQASEMKIDALLSGGTEREKGLRKTSHALGIDHASLNRSLKDGPNIKLERVKKVLDYLVYEIRITEKTVDRIHSKNHLEQRRRTELRDVGS